MEAPDALLPLLASLDGVTRLIGRGDALPPFDLHCPLMSLPLAFGTTLATVPAHVPYLRAPTERVEAWRTRLPAGPGSASPGRASRATRTTATARSFSRSSSRFWRSRESPLSACNARYRAADLAGLAQCPNLVRLEEALTDFADTAAVIEQLDLVIAVDTAVAHLAGALGKPVFVLISYIQDWRWLAGRADSPWYPTARIFRQPARDRRLGDSRDCGGRPGAGRALSHSPNFPPDCATMREPWPRAPNKPSPARATRSI